jgi:hypothetical protein
MPAGPHLIFDKSALECLSVDETNWLDNFFLTVITPLFFMETLADLEKEVSKGRAPEQVVGSIAIRTPDMQSTACAHHRTILQHVLAGRDMPLDGRVPRAGGKVVELDGKRGVFYEKSPEQEALDRWHEFHFLDIERQIAKRWRRDLCSGIDYTKQYAFFQNWFLLGKPKSLAEVKTLTDGLIDNSPQDGVLRFGVELLGIPEAKEYVIGRWERAGSPSMKIFAPHFRHMLAVELFFHLAIASDQISRVRPKGKADNKVDIAYLYYLPFCHIFVSNDKLHKRVVPLFLRKDQTFVDAMELKADLTKLDDHYGALPEDLKTSGFHKFANYPPREPEFLVARLWDSLGTQWRDAAANYKPPDQSKHPETIAELDRIREAAQTADPAARVSIEDTEFMEIVRYPQRKKGKWLRYGRDV